VASFQRLTPAAPCGPGSIALPIMFAASHVLRERPFFSNLVIWKSSKCLPDKDHGPVRCGSTINLERLSMLIQQLKPLDRQSSSPIWKA